MNCFAIIFPNKNSVDVIKAGQLFWELHCIWYFDFSEVMHLLDFYDAEKVNFWSHLSQEWPEKAHCINCHNTDKEQVN